MVSASRGVNETAASPHVTAVGGTQFNATFDANGNDVGGVAESVWDDTAGASGGGQSSVFAKPTYQNGPTPNDKVRDIPDLALGASGRLPGFYTIVDANGSPALSVWGGTSVAAPMWAGVARLITKRPGYLLAWRRIVDSAI